jgi:enoyl-CoA hydratase
MSQRVTYHRSGPLARIVMDDGRLNVMSPAMLRDLHAAFDQAEHDNAIVVLTGRDTIFSAGFDLKVFATGTADDIHEMMTLGARLATRVFGFPTPVVAACNGHAYPMGAFLMLAADIRIGADGPFRIGLNEVAIGLAVPHFGIELARQRLAPAYFQRAALTGQMFAPQEAAAAGFLDQVVPADALPSAAEEAAAALSQLDLAAHADTKIRVRGQATETIEALIAEHITLESARESVARR